MVLSLPRMHSLSLAMDHSFQRNLSDVRRHGQNVIAANVCNVTTLTKPSWTPTCAVTNGKIRICKSQLRVMGSALLFFSDICVQDFGLRTKCVCFSLGWLPSHVHSHCHHDNGTNTRKYIYSYNIMIRFRFFQDFKTVT